ncbi:DUF6884 domain-containing protein [Oceanobacillus halotolerans]|uniref:DUF6884 domain-containing protein n=1 Tax=Oceanobacillus halotolerans TaxID=2663380 RepID=UPI0013DB4DCD|nr:DUF6884 domain-containing protein [Oceanobacillus halotolerans]
MTQLSIIPCGRKKIWDIDETVGNAPVKNVYLSRFHRLCRGYAELFTDDWVVLSAKHGFMFPDDVVDGPYDVTFNQKSNEIISIEALRDQVDRKSLNRYDQLVILTGKKYEPIINTCFENNKMVFPLKGYKGIGYMQQALKGSIETKQPLHSRKDR